MKGSVISIAEKDASINFLRSGGTAPAAGLTNASKTSATSLE